MKRYLHRICSVIVIGTLFVGSAVADSSDTYQYRDELKNLKMNPSYRIVFDKKAHEGLREIERDLENYSQLRSRLSKLARMMFLASDALVVTDKTMPKLYAYVDEICKRGNIETPVIFVSRHKGIFNAFAAKLFMSSGGILLGQDVLLEGSDKEIEAVIAHEIGHIKYNHVNKTLFLHYVCIVGVYFALNQTNIHKYLVTGSELLDVEVKIIAALVIDSFLSPLIVGKRFEKEADEFACKENGKAEGLIAFFERLIRKEKKVDSDFDEVYALLKERSCRLSSNDSSNLYMNYYIVRWFHNLGKKMRWLYHNTRLGAHPSHESRIQQAKKYLV